MGLLVLLLAGCERDTGERNYAQSDDFTILAQSAEGYSQAVPGRRLAFPADHGAHPGYRIEWWYLTANLQDQQGRQYGAQWTLFRSAIEPPADDGAAQPLAGNPWQDPQVYMAHMAVTTPDDHFSYQRYARGGLHGDGNELIARAGVRAQPFSAWLDDWELSSSGPGWLPLVARARQDQTAMELNLSSAQPLVLQGEQGFSQKHPGGGGSYYYSQPFLQAEGWLEVAGERVEVSGQAWLDREWSSQFLQADQVGWDWFALHLDSGEKLMLFQLRGKDGLTANFRHAVLISPKGEKRKLDAEQLGLTPLATSEVAGRRLPTRWRVELPEIGREMEVSALHPWQWMDVDFAYWEGVVLAAGDGPGNRGRGYLEMTGYRQQGAGSGSDAE
jgi:predicted secreted hydrolase